MRLRFSLAVTLALPFTGGGGCALHSNGFGGATGSATSTGSSTAASASATSSSALSGTGGASGATGPSTSVGSTSSGSGSSTTGSGSTTSSSSTGMPSQCQMCLDTSSNCQSQLGACMADGICLPCMTCFEANDAASCATCKTALMAGNQPGHNLACCAQSKCHNGSQCMSELSSIGMQTCM